MFSNEIYGSFSTFQAKQATINATNKMQFLFSFFLWPADLLEFFSACIL